MESDQQVTSKDMMKVVPPSGVEQFQGATNNVGLGQQGGGLMRQSSMSKNNNCLCSPTTHAGSFRCRLHRTPNLQRTKSIESESLRDQPHASVVDEAITGDASKDRIH